MTLTKRRVAVPQGSEKVPMVDDYTDQRRAGRVLGSRSTAGALRRGRDVEGRIAIDNGALRLQPLITPGWGRQGIVYGPYPRAAGLAFTVSITNGHNTSQAAALTETIKHRLWRWVVGNHAEPPARRLLGWLTSRQQRGTLRRFRWWLRTTRAFYRLPEFNENLALGWFASEAPADPLEGGAAFVVHAAAGDNGEVWARVGERPLAAFRGLQNLQVQYLVVLRERGAAYYMSSVPNAHGMAAHPNMRPVAIDPFGVDPVLYAGFYQCVLGQIGFRVDTRVHGVKVASAPELAAWYGSAHAADALVGEGNLGGARAEIGGTWRVHRGRFALGAAGARAATAGALAALDPQAASGLVHALIETADAGGTIGLVWRMRDERSRWTLELSHEDCRLVMIDAGRRTLIARDPTRRLLARTTHSVQILDGHGQFSLYLDGARLFDAWFSDARLQDATAVGLYAERADGPLVRAFEAHPASVPMPSGLRLAAPWVRDGRRLVVADAFAGEPGDLDRRPLQTGGRLWQRTLGRGAIELTGDGAARVVASVEAPNPGRTAYTVAWDRRDFADLETTIVPPGSGRGQGQNCRCGLIFWQDARNYLTFTLWLEDQYEGASVAMFPHLDGFEELYDAVWTMLGSRIHWSRPFRLRIVFDGARFTVFVDGEPVLHRALTDLYPDQPPLRITRVGLAVNWEWGDDTGSMFKDFTARA